MSARSARRAARALLLALPLLLSCAGNEGTLPQNEWKEDLPIRAFRILPPRITVEISDYVKLPDRFRAMAEYNDLSVAEVKVDIWQKVSGIGSVVHDEFRAYGETGEIHIKVVHRNPYADKEAECTVIVVGTTDLPLAHVPALAPELSFRRVMSDPVLVGAMNDPDAAADESPRRRVFLSPHYVAVNEVTRDTYARFLNAYVGDVAPLCDPAAAGLLHSAAGYEVEFSESNFPMTHVTYRGAEAFCAWLGTGYRLPTEAEWEWAARGGYESRYPYGQTFSASMAHVNRTRTTQVRSYPANAFGLYDTDGNVREICRDWYAAAYYGQSVNAADPAGPASGLYRALRGGSYLKQYGVRVSERDKFVPEERLPDVGFRPVYDPTP